MRQKLKIAANRNDLFFLPYYPFCHDYSPINFISCIRLRLISSRSNSKLFFMHAKRKFYYAVPVLILIFFVACKGKEKTAAIVSPEVNVVTVGQRTVPVYTEFVGQTYGITDVDIMSRVDGWVTSMHFKEGDVVKKGQLLYVIDDLPIRTRIDGAEARLAEARTLMVRAKSDLDRVEPLVKMNALSKRDLDAADATYKASQSEVDVANASLKNARIELDYTRIKSPVTGIIGISKVQVGDYVGRSAMGAPLNTVSSVGSVRVRFPISESEYLRIARRSKIRGKEATRMEKVPVELILADGSVYDEKGYIALANREVDAETGSLIVQAVFANQQNLLRPGQYVKVRVLADNYPDAVLVPQQAVNVLQSIHQVFVLNDSNKVAPRVVKTGARVGSNWIITEGLKAGEKIAIVGSAAVNPKVTVKPIPMKWNYDSTSTN
jgi:membrane fusion protein, multidrug efflux system